MTNIAKFDVDADGGDYGFQLTPSSTHKLKLRLNPALGVQRVMFQVYDPTAFDPSLGIGANPPRSSNGAPTITLDNLAGSTGQAVNASTPTAEVDFPAPTGVHTWTVRCIVNGGMRAGPNGIPVPDPDLIYERILYLPGPIAGTRKIVSTESTQGGIEGWSEPINAMIAAAGGSGETNTASNLGGGDAGVFKQKVGVNFELRPLAGVGGIGIALNGDVIEIDGTGLGGGAVDSVFTRTGAVVATASDYDASQVDNDSGVAGATVADALDALDAAAPNAHTLGGASHNADTLANLNTKVSDATLVSQAYVDAADALASLTDGSRAFTNPVGGVTPTASAHLTTKDYVDSLAQGVEWQDSVFDRDLTAPPGGPTAGDRYIVAAGGTGAWSTHDDEIAEWDGSAWVFTVPTLGMSVGVDDENRSVRWNGSAWVFLGTTIDHGNLAGTGDDDHTQYSLAPGAVTDNRLVRFDGTSGRATQQSAAAEDDSGDVTGWRSVQVNGTAPFLGLYDDAPVSGERLWKIYPNGSSLYIEPRSDADDAGSPIVRLDRNGTAALSIELFANLDMNSNSVRSASIVQVLESGAGTNEKLWDTTATGDVLKRRTRTDADGAGADYEDVERQGTAVSRIRHMSQYGQAETVDSFSVEVDTASAPAASSILRDKAGAAVALDAGFTYTFEIEVEIHDASVYEEGEYRVVAHRPSAGNVALVAVRSAGDATTSGLDMQFAADTGSQIITCQPISSTGEATIHRKVRWSSRMVRRKPIVTVDT